MTHAERRMTHKIILSVTTQMKDRLLVIATAEDASVAWVIRRAVRRYIEQYDEERES